MSNNANEPTDILAEFSQLAALHQQVSTDLAKRQRDIAAVQQELNKTQDELSQRNADLDRALARIERLESELAAEKSTAARTVAQAEESKEALAAQLAIAQETERSLQSQRAEALAAQLAIAQETARSLQSQRDTYQRRLQTQYSLRWNRIGGVLRDARSLRGAVRAPVRIMRILRNAGAAPEGPTASTSRTRASVVARAATIIGCDPQDVIPPSPLALLMHEAVDSVAAWGDDATAVAARELLRRGDQEISGELVAAAIKRGDATWIASAVEAAEATATLDLRDDTRLALSQALRDEGQIRRPLQILQAAKPTSGNIADLRATLGYNLEILEKGVMLSPPKLTKPSRLNVDSFYLLHNSLPYQSGGYATRTHGLLTGLKRSGRDVVGVTRPGFPAKDRVFDQRPGTKEVDFIDGVRYSRLIGPVTAMPRRDLQGFVNCYGELMQPLITQLGPKLIHGVSNWWNGHAAVAIAQALDVPSIYEVRGLWEVTRSSRQEGWAGSDTYELDARYEADAAKSAHRVIAITGGLRDELVRRGVDQNKITLVPNAVDVKRFASTPADDSVRHQLGWKDRCIIGFVGSVTFYEGLDLLLSAVALAKNETTTPLGVLIVGDGPVLNSLNRLACSLGIEDLCHFAGRVPHNEVERYLQAIDITPFPRLPLPVCEMVSPLKPLESMASKTSVIVSSVQALAEMVPDGCGLIIEKGSITELSDAIVQLADDPTLRADLADNAFTWVSENRNWDVVSKLVADLYAELID